MMYGVGSSLYMLAKVRNARGLVSCALVAFMTSSIALLDKGASRTRYTLVSIPRCSVGNCRGILMPLVLGSSDTSTGLI